MKAKDDNELFFRIWDHFCKLYFKKLPKDLAIGIFGSTYSSVGMS
jgi:hypothetical protein